MAPWSQPMGRENEERVEFNRGEVFEFLSRESGFFSFGSVVPPDGRRMMESRHGKESCLSSMLFLALSTPSQHGFREIAALSNE